MFKGRPVGSSPEHTYVCEYRVDRAARLFSKVARSRHHVCTKPYAFEMFPERIKHYRTYLVSFQYSLSEKHIQVGKICENYFSNLFILTQPHSLDGVSGVKLFKEKKKTVSQEIEHGGQKTEARDVNRNSKDQPQTTKPSIGKTRRRSTENLTVPTAIVSDDNVSVLINLTNLF